MVVVDFEGDVIGWWSMNEFHLPVLAGVARETYQHNLVSWQAKGSLDGRVSSTEDKNNFEMAYFKHI
eukprot:snap_masked-scaffold_22-processed-gene-4.21-mRNA-1 protein AED:1.00 eAED:1.00 QI:0/-1/0/0/-1/1/1/0/66